MKPWLISPAAIAAYRGHRPRPLRRPDDETELELLAVLLGARPTPERTPEGWQVWTGGREGLRLAVEEQSGALVLRDLLPVEPGRPTRGAPPAPPVYRARRRT